jgi:NTP pyrophosphatase (non-canonical NTP hydrolase)
MEMETYRERSQVYSSFTSDEGEEKRHSSGHHACAALGLVGEAGEVADYLKKVAYHGHVLDKDKLCKELGDALWYVAMAAEAANLPMPRASDDEVVPVLPALRVLFAVRLCKAAADAADHLTDFAFKHGSLDEHLLFTRLQGVLLHIRTVGLASGISLSEIAVANLDKLAARYPEGVFSQARSINRTA